MHTHARNRKPQAKEGESSSQAPAVKALKPDEAGTALRKLDEMGWLKVVETGNSRGGNSTRQVQLGLRSVFDLRGYIET